MSIYDITVKDMKGNDVKLEKYRGKVMLIVNTATGCGFTPQYKGLEALYEKYKDQGLAILDFPCNQFLGQAPGTNEEIASYCELNYGVTFDQFAKIDVNGENEDPLYTFLKENKRSIIGKSIKWNFTKFLVDREGTITGRYEPVVKPEKLEEKIKELI